ncbi:phage tail tape measure protein [Rhizobiaceae bacterium n13]|uniref:phage tail tape measure protein n=1 Tax=Ferirhizobium litorale TaxID=2927786 RepID=UPI0024B296F8|nr:phage tail tape measure protein [Fererhizobium litorale]MDI7865047.1 phage tail tape measure protein [Fererhizobium litorale]
MAGSAVIGSLRVDLGANTAAFTNGLKSAQSGLASFGKAVKTGLAVAATGAAAGIAAIGVSVKNTVDAADEMSKAAQKIGVPIEELSRLKYAADLSGVSFEGLQTAVGRLSRNMAETLTKPTGEAAKAFEQLGIDVKNSDGTLKSSTEVLSSLADKFAGMPDGAEKTAVAMQLMGRSGADMIPLLAGGSEALNKLASEADTFGQVFTQEMGANAEAFNDNISRLQGAFGNVAAEITEKLLPYLRQFSDWLVVNAPQIAQFAVSTVEAFAAVGRGIGSTIQFFTDVDASLRAFGESLRAGVAQAQQFATDLVGVFAAVPGQMLEIGSNIILGLWEGIKGKLGSLKTWVADGIKEAIPDSLKRLMDMHSPSRVMHEMGENIMLGLQNGMGSVDVKAGVTETANSIENAFQGIGSSIGEALAGTKKWSDVLKEVLNSVLQIAFSGFGGGGAGGGGGGFGGFLSSIFGGLFGFARGGTILPGGGGGIDSQLVAFRKSPNERVDITKPGQSLHSGGEMTVHVTGELIDRGGNIVGIIDQRAQAQVAKATPAILGEAQRRVVPTMAKYESVKASDWRGA